MLSHSVVLGDSGEFLTAAAINGVPHDPGFPLYSLLTRIFFLLGHSAWAVNLTSAIFASLALTFTYRLVKTMTGNGSAALFATLSLGTYEFFWFYALVVQIHTLQVFILSLLYLSLVYFLKTGKLKYLYLTGIAFGLGMTNSQTIVLALPSIFIALFFMRKIISWRVVVKLVAFSVSCLLLYFYTFISASFRPALNWGQIHDLQSLAHMFFRMDYGTFNLTSGNLSAPFIYSSFVYYLEVMIKSGWLVLLFALISLYYLKKKDATYLAILFGLLFNGPFYYLIMNQHIFSVVYKANVEQYLSYSFFFVAVLGGLGFYILTSRYKIDSKVLYLIAFLLFVPLFFINLGKINLSRNNLVSETTKFQFSQIPKDGIVLTVGDDFYFPSLYLQNLERFRTDITVIDLGLPESWYQDSVFKKRPELASYFNNSGPDYIKFCQYFSAQGKLFIYPWYPDYDVYFKNKCDIIPYGLLAKVVPKNQAGNISAIKNYNDESWVNYLKIASLESYKNSTQRSREELFLLAEQKNFIGIYYNRSGKQSWALNEFVEARTISLDEYYSFLNEAEIYFEKGNYKKAADLLEKAIAREPNASDLYYSLGIINVKLNNLDKAYENFKDYSDFNPPADERLKNAQDFIQQYQTTNNVL